MQDSPKARKSIPPFRCALEFCKPALNYQRLFEISSVADSQLIVSTRGRHRMAEAIRNDSYACAPASPLSLSLTTAQRKGSGKFIERLSARPTFQPGPYGINCEAVARKKKTSGASINDQALLRIICGAAHSRAVLLRLGCVR